MDRRRDVWLAAVLISAGACTPQPYPEDIARQQQEATDRALMAEYIGRPLWTVGIANYFVCPSKAMMLGPEGCFTGRGRFTFDSFEGLYPLTDGEVFMHVTFADGRSGFTHFYLGDLKFDVVDHDPMKEPGIYPSFLDNLKAGKAVLQRRKLPGALLHMTQAQVLAGAWGKPDRVVERESYRHGSVEWWIYPEDNLLVFQNGELVDIQRSRK
ncbi:MAG TPA: hypothetical protein VKZ79_03570 [Alphaproteobacteria bacterium]|nr:hypothetical protein [Alphaproteobacteria bacterium]